MSDLSPDRVFPRNGSDSDSEGSTSTTAASPGAAGDNDAGPFGDLITTGTTIAAGIGILAVFGWVSRRFERQADTFAVQHFNGPDQGAPQLITVDAVTVVSETLEMIAQLNAVAARRRSWRHGSIVWRQAYLRSIIGCDRGRLPVDRQVRWIKTVAATVVVSWLAWEIRDSSLLPW